MVDIKTLVDEKISEDTEFQTSLEEMSDEDKETAISEKRSVLIQVEVDALEEKSKKADEIAKNQEIRAKKAEAEAKKPKAEPDPAKKSEEKEEYSLKDIRALNDVHDEDVDKLVNYAKFMGISIAEAKALPEMISFRNDAEEKRKTAQTTSIKSGGRVSKANDEELLNKANQGNVPEDDDSIAKLVALQRAKK